MDVDPLASMRCWAVDLLIGGREYEIPALPAADWWPVLVSGDPLRVLDLALSTDDLDEALLDGQVSGDEIGESIFDAIAEATGRSAHVAFCLVTAATHGWSVVGGELAKRGFRWDVMPIGAALDAVYVLLLENIPEKKDRERFQRLLDSDPGRKRDPEKIKTEFELLAGPRPTGGRTATAGQSGSARPKTQQRPRLPRQADPSTEPTPPRARPARSARPAMTASPGVGA